MKRQALLLGVCITLIGCTSASRPEPGFMVTARDADGRPARILSAFLGLDDALPIGGHRLCVGAAGRDGMPVVLSHTIDPGTLQREDFRVITSSGLERTPFCVTLAPANDAGELRTVLLVGDFGGGADPPAIVRIVGDILSDGVTGGPISFRGEAAGVIPLEAGPTLVLAEIVPRDEWLTRGENAGSFCPERTAQVVRVTWAGGVHRPNGDEAGEAERARYRVTVERPDGGREVIVPIALADLNDRDNNHQLCLDVVETPVTVSFPAGHLVDPNGDRNPDTLVEVQNSVTIGSVKESLWPRTRRTPAVRLTRRASPARPPSSCPRSTMSSVAWRARGSRASRPV
jgi:hypothetical protein